VDAVRFPAAFHRSAQCFTRCRAVWVFDLHGRHFTRGDRLFGGQESVADKCAAKATSGTERSGIWLEVIPLDRGIAEAVAQIPLTMVPDMPDRIIAATALFLKLPLVTRDHKIQAAEIETIW
jgi:predicted nucleic acid-binding protein